MEKQNFHEDATKELRVQFGERRRIFIMARGFCENDRISTLFILSHNGKVVVMHDIMLTNARPVT
jgi:hypothetical protein